MRRNPSASSYNGAGKSSAPKSPCSDSYLVISHMMSTISDVSGCAQICRNNCRAPSTARLMELAAVEPADQHGEMRQLELERRDVELAHQSRARRARARRALDLRKDRALARGQFLGRMARQEHLQRRDETQRIRPRQSSAYAMLSRSRDGTRLVIERADVVAIDARPVRWLSDRLSGSATCP